MKKWYTILITRFRKFALSKCLTTWQANRQSLNKMALNYPYRFSVFKNYVKESIIRKIGILVYLKKKKYIKERATGLRGFSKKSKLLKINECNRFALTHLQSRLLNSILFSSAVSVRTFRGNTSVVVEIAQSDSKEDFLTSYCNFALPCRFLARLCLKPRLYIKMLIAYVTINRKVNKNPTACKKVRPKHNLVLLVINN